MKYILIVILLCLPCLLFGQNFKLRVGGSVSISNAYLDDLNNPIGDVTLSELVGGTYDSYFQMRRVNTLFSQRRSSDPNIGGNIHVIGLLKIRPNLSLRIGTEFQLVKLKRVIDRRVANYDTYDNYKTTTEIFDIQYKVPLTAFYISLPFGLQYNFEKKGLSVFGGVLFTTRIADRNVETRLGILSIGKQKAIFINPIMEAFFLSANLGMSYQIRNRINFDIQAVRGFTNMFDVLSRVPQQSLFQQISVGVSYQLL